MLLNVDHSGLEVVVTAYLSKDEVAYNEIIEDFDFHADNQHRFGLPERVIAKIFIFRLLYGGTAKSYANDALFIPVSTDEKFWQSIIDKFYLKYKGIKRWHESIVEEAMLTGMVKGPTGRIWTFEPYEKYNGELIWPRTKILNYPVQGTAADLVMLSRILLSRLLVQEKLENEVKLICTVHDSIVLDLSACYVEKCVKLVKTAWKMIPTEWEKWFKIPFDLPTRCDISIGNNWKDMEDIK